jgi:hypothetical protein
MLTECFECGEKYLNEAPYIKRWCDKCCAADEMEGDEENFDLEESRQGEPGHAMRLAETFESHGGK